MNYSILRMRVYTIIERGEKYDKKSLYFDYFIIVLVLLSVISTIWESYPEANQNYQKYFYGFEIISITVFTLEYLLRLWTAPLKYPYLPAWKAYLKYFLSFIALVDLIAILPFYLPFLGVGDLRLLRMMRLLRLLRVFKLNRYSRALNLVYDVLKERGEELVTTVFFALILLLVSSTLMYYVEHDINPQGFPNIIATLWWAVVTLTTVGYGDVVPITMLGKILNGITALIGIGVVALPTSILSAGFLEKVQERKRIEKEETEQIERQLLQELKERNGEIEEENKNSHSTHLCYCPHCGGKLPEID
ncbi:Kef-type K+ ransport system, predicted NAD-binding component [Bernardetia litoralis DSM 6794]|uniref:Kef-type K+ ransport system, predicted NAD-binding component n=1 Tax=Bernardetia litoralis (strain ATCC 23117 / DSM 6794 / NBRC 15988 / NCIMB 1366 / Fx l1 / Sio-4) TaxID=880071 RepID=I4AN88_BERLS|nr:ion transporter [Bernardetia litoralis]AFM05423.1 Kef-type K+ ransport system, predicted NAD-binding component [Bernardetia litoralis DSM 6794]